MPTAALSSTVALPLSIVSTAIAVAIAACGALALAHYRALPPVLRWQRGMTGHPLAGAPSVSIIVPAHNEEHTLPRLLRSLIALDYPAYEVIIVDVTSTDATPAIAERYAADTEGLVRALHLAGPEAGWTAKNWACWQGALASRGDWLLFTDADTEHEYGSLRAAVAAAGVASAGALALFPRQQCLSFWERLLLPFAYQQHFIGVRPAHQTRADGPTLASEQYVLIHSDAYAACGGHAAVAGSASGGVALAGALKRAGFTVLVCHGEELVRARTFAGLGALMEGIQMHTRLFLRERRAAGALVVLSVACNTLVLGTLAGAILARAPFAAGAAALAYGIQVALLMPWERACGVRRGYALLAPLAALVLALIALVSAPYVLAAGDRHAARGRALRQRAEREAVRRG